jgi:hypothetical protein
MPRDDDESSQSFVDASSSFCAQTLQSYSTMKSVSPLVPVILQAALANAGWFHWGHHDEHILTHYRRFGPFGLDGTPATSGYETVCDTMKTFNAKEFKRSELKKQPPFGMLPWLEAVENFLGEHDYPGHWKGEHVEEDPEYLVMEYTDVPKPVRKWIENHHERGTHKHKKWLFAVLEKPKGDEKITKIIEPSPSVEGGEASQTASAGGAGGIPDKEKILFFAAGSIYEILPLFVAEGSKCECECIYCQRIC